MGRRRHEKDERLGSWFYKKSFCHRVTDIHNFVAKREEACGAKRFRKEVGQVLVRAHVRDADSTHLYKLSDEVVFLFDVACALVVFWLC